MKLLPNQTKGHAIYNIHIRGLKCSQTHLHGIINNSLYTNENSRHFINLAFKYNFYLKQINNWKRTPNQSPRTKKEKSNEKYIFYFDIWCSMNFGTMEHDVLKNPNFYGRLSP